LYKGFKTASIIIATIAILIDVLLFLVAIPEAIDNQSLTGGGRAQSEFFTMPLMLIGGGFAILCILVLISNFVTDIVRTSKKAAMYNRNILAYCLLVFAIFFPYFGTTVLIDLMYSGWK